MNRVTHPASRLDLLDGMPKGGVVAELGVFEGDFAAQILQRCNPRTLYLVDLWRGNVPSGDAHGNHVRTVNLDGMMNRLARRFAGQPVGLVQGFSYVWLDDQLDNSLDWVYIDTAHTYDCTRLELRAACHVVKPGGYICGHDYAPQFPGVMQAVDEFVEKRGLELQIFAADGLPSYKICNEK